MENRFVGGGGLRPRKVYAIHDEQARWVQQMFRWFVDEQQTLSWIVRKLNELQAPKCRRSSKAKWHRDLVVRTLRSTKYIGFWPWGKTVQHRDPLTGKRSSQDRDPEESAQWQRKFPELRIIDDERFNRAQQRLDQQSAACGNYRREDGLLHGSDGRQGQRHLLQRVFRCGHCQSTMICGGEHGRYLICPGARDGICHAHRMLSRKLVKELLFKVLQERILGNPDWVESIYHAARAAWRHQQADRPDELSRLRQAAAELDRKIERLVTQIEEAAESDPTVSERLKERRREHSDIAGRLRQLEAAEAAQPSEPTREFVQAELERLNHVLSDATPAANQALIAFLGGPIALKLIDDGSQRRSFWRAHLTLTTSRVLRACQPAADQATPEVSSEPETATETVVLDFVLPGTFDRLVDQTWERLQQRRQLKDIAAELGIRETRMTKVMKEVARRYGNGLSPKELRLQYQPVSTRVKAVEQYVDPAMELYDQGQLLQAIAEALGTHRNMITKAINLGLQRQGRPPLDGRNRRSSLEFKGRSPWLSRRPETPSASSD